MTDVERVREAYASMAQPYIDLVDGRWPDGAEDTALVERHLTGLDGPVLDLGCGPGHWTDRLRAAGVDVTGVDLVPEFVAHARATYPTSRFRLGSMSELDVPDHSVAGALSWYSTIHLAPPALDGVLAELHRVLVAGGVLVVGFFDSADGVAAFDHRVVTAYRWPRRPRRPPRGGRVRRAGATAAPGRTARPPVRRGRPARVLSPVRRPGPPPGVGA